MVVVIEAVVITSAVFTGINCLLIYLSRKKQSSDKQNIKDYIDNKIAEHDEQIKKLEQSMWLQRDKIYSIKINKDAIDNVERYINDTRIDIRMLKSRSDNLCKNSKVIDCISKLANDHEYP